MYEELILISQEEVSSVSTTGTSTRLTAMVIEAGRGPTKPVTFIAGAEDAIKTMFGNPSEEYPQILGAILANRNSNLLISAPDVGGKADSIYLTGTGFLPETRSNVKGGKQSDDEGTQPTTKALPVGSLAKFYVKYTGVSELSLTLSREETTGVFELRIFKGNSMLGSYTFSLVVGAKDGFGINIFVGDVLRNNSYLGCDVIDSRVPANYPTEIQETTLQGGMRGTLGDDALNLGLDEIALKGSTHVDIFCDVTEKSVVYEKFQAWSLKQWPNSIYLVPVPANNIEQVKPWMETTFKANPKMMVVANRGIYTLINYGGGLANLSCTADLVRNLVLGSTLFDAAPVAGYPDKRGYGGNLTGPILGLIWDLTADQRVAMSKQYVNPIVQDTEVGYLCYSQKSGKKSEGVSDSIPVVRAASYIRRGLVSVLKRYIQRWNEPNAIAEIEIKLDNLLSPMVGSSPKIVSTYIIDISDKINTPQKRAKGILAGRLVVNFNNIIETVEIQFVITDGSVEIN